VEGNALGKLAQLWNPRSNHSLRRYWISFEDRIIIGGENFEQAGVLSLRRARQGELHARLRVMGREFEQAVTTGNDVAVWINGLELFIGVKAIDDEGMLLAFGIPPGSRVNVTLDSGGGVEAETKAFPIGNRGANAGGSGCAIGLCQTRP
jgi:hypothetical protein